MFDETRNSIYFSRMILPCKLIEPKQDFIVQNRQKTEFCHIFLCKLLNISHDRKRISKLPHTALQSFVITTSTTRAEHLSHFEKILITESEACQNSNCVSFWHSFFVNISRTNCNYVFFLLSNVKVPIL